MIEIEPAYYDGYYQEVSLAGKWIGQLCNDSDIPKAEFRLIAIGAENQPSYDWSEPQSIDKSDIPASITSIVLAEIDRQIEALQEQRRALLDGNQQEA